MGLTKLLVRTAVIGAVVVGGTVLLAGPQRTSALFGKLHNRMMDGIDSRIDEPTQLRSQLESLQSQYPERIAGLRGDLAQLHEQLRQLERDRAVAERVVHLADADVEVLAPLLAQAETARAEALPGTAVTVRFQTAALTIDQAYQRAGQIQQTRQAYASRAADAARDRAYLEQQASRLTALLAQLEKERAEFQSQIWQIDRQIDAVARNDRLIEMMHKRQKTIDEASRYEAGSLDQLRSRLADVRSRQEARLELLASDQGRVRYEELARIQLEGETLGAEEQPELPRIEIGAPVVTGQGQPTLELGGPRLR